MIVSPALHLNEDTASQNDPLQSKYLHLIILYFRELEGKHHNNVYIVNVIINDNLI